MGSDDRNTTLTPHGKSSDVDSFVAAAQKLPVAGAVRGRLIFALDATMSRQPTWDLAQGLQGKMFDAAAGVGGLDVQLVYFRGQHECCASNFVSGGQGLAALMGRISVQGGLTQLRRVLLHARDEARRAPVGVLVFVGDAMEESVDPLIQTAGELALLGVKAFMFLEGDDPNARRAFQEIARVTGGAFGSFDAGAASRLAALLKAAASYAAGGRGALEAFAKQTPEARLLLQQLRG